MDRRYGLVALLLAAVVVAEPALAGGVTAMPWESPLMVIMDSLTGPVAMVFSIIGVAVAGAALIFGGEMADFTRRVVMLVLVAALLLGAASLITNLFPGTGASIAVVAVIP